jgi:uncharacterized protein YciI
MKEHAMIRCIALIVPIMLVVAGCAAPQTRDAPEHEPAYAMSDEPWFVYFIHPTRADFIAAPTDAEMARVGEHFNYLKSLMDEGTVLLAGPSTDPPYTGIVIFQAADRRAAQAIVDGDPAVRAGVFEARMSPLALSLFAPRDR